MYSNNPEYAKVGDKKYKINTDFRVALKCQEIAMDSSISDYERPLAIIYLLYGDEGLNNKQDYADLIRIALDYLKCGEEVDESDNEKPDMDFKQDFRLIEASFRSDYGITLSNEKMHWWDFYMYLNGLTDKCVLNKVRELRNYDTSTIKDQKEKNKIKKAQKRFALVKNDTLTKKEEESVKKFYELTGLKRKE